MLHAQQKPDQYWNIVHAGQQDGEPSQAVAAKELTIRIIAVAAAPVQGMVNFEVSAQVSLS